MSYILNTTANNVQYIEQKPLETMISKLAEIIITSISVLENDYNLFHNNRDSYNRRPDLLYGDWTQDDDPETMIIEAYEPYFAVKRHLHTTDRLVEFTLVLAPYFYPDTYLYLRGTLDVENETINPKCLSDGLDYDRCDNYDLNETQKSKLRWLVELLISDWSEYREEHP